MFDDKDIDWWEKFNVGGNKAILEYIKIKTEFIEKLRILSCPYEKDSPEWHGFYSIIFNKILDNRMG